MTFIASTQAQAHPHPRCKGELHEESLLNSAKPRLRAARAWSATGLFSLLLSAPLTRFEAAWLALSLGPLTALGEGQKPECPSGEAGGRGGLGALIISANIKKKRPPSGDLFVSRQR